MIIKILCQIQLASNNCKKKKKKKKKKEKTNKKENEKIEKIKQANIHILKIIKSGMRQQIKAGQ